MNDTKLIINTLNHLENFNKDERIPSDDTIRALGVLNELNDRLAEEGITDENISDLDILFAQAQYESRRRKAPIQRELSLDDTQPMPFLFRKQAE